MIKLAEKKILFYSILGFLKRDWKIWLIIGLLIANLSYLIAFVGHPAILGLNKNIPGVEELGGTGGHGIPVKGLYRVLTLSDPKYLLYGIYDRLDDAEALLRGISEQVGEVDQSLGRHILFGCE